MSIIYVRGPNPIWFFNNLTGMPLDDTYWAFFLTNDLPYVPQAVFQDPNGISPWQNPLEFQPSAGLPNNLYFDPTETYRIEVRKGPNQTDPLIWLVQNYQAGTGGTGITDALTISPNLIINSNFSDIFFTSSYTYTQGSPGTYTLNVAPGWQLVLVGAGTTILTQTPIPGNDNIAGNPPFYLGINNNGWTSATLVQTLSNNGALFANGAIAVTFTAQGVSVSEPLTVNYVPNGPPNSQSIFSGTIATGGFVQYFGAVDLNASQNTSLNGAANVQIQFILPPTGNIDLTNIQIVGQSTPLSVNFIPPTPTFQGSVPSFQEQTYGQIVNGEFYIYAPSILYQPKNTLLTGWNFGLNPWQFETTTVTNIPVNQYTADQTIVIQQAYVAGAVGNNIAVGRAPLASNYGFEVKAVTAHNTFGLLQYIAPQTITPYWGRKLSSMVKASITTTHASVVKFKMRLIWKQALPNTVAQADPIATWTEGGDPVAAGGYALIAPMNDPVYTLTSTPTSFAFDQFQLPALGAVNTTLGILLYTTTNMNQAATADIIVFNDISLVANDFAIETQPQTADEVLRECQYYFEMSNPVGTLPGVATFNGVYHHYSAIDQSGANAILYETTIELKLKQTKNKLPTYTFWEPSAGTAGDFYLAIASGASQATNSPTLVPATQWTAAGQSVDALLLSPNVTAAIISPASGKLLGYEGITLFHYQADSRLGK